jgi:hypothetical protein
MPYNVIPGRQGEESILICYSPPFDTRLPINYGTKVETANPTLAGVEHAMARVTQEAKLYAGACILLRNTRRSRLRCGRRGQSGARDSPEPSLPVFSPTTPA